MMAMLKDAHELTDPKEGAFSRDVQRGRPAEDGERGFQSTDEMFLPVDFRPPPACKKVKNAKMKTNPTMNKNARRISFHVTPDVSRTNSAMAPKKNKKRTSQKASVEKRKQPKNIIQARGSKRLDEGSSRLR